MNKDPSFAASEGGSGDDAASKNGHQMDTCRHGFMTSTCPTCCHRSIYAQSVPIAESLARSLVPPLDSAAQSYVTAMSNLGWSIPAQGRRAMTSADLLMLSKSPTSCLSEDNYEVVLDDGTRQKRSVSLSSSMPRIKYLDDYRYYHRRPEEGEEPTETTALLSKSRARQSLLEDSSDSEDDNSSPKDSGRRRWIPSLTHQQKMVLKCSFAYFLGSLFTFVPALNRVVGGGSSVSSHVVATVTVFFNPAKTVGGMVQAAGFGLIYAVAALSVCLLSLASADYLMMVQHSYLWACLVILGVWLTGSTFVIAFLKARFPNQASIRSASSLAFIILFSVLVKEASTEYDTTKIEHTFAIVLVGTAISVTICLVVWPMRATKKLRSDIDATLHSIRVLLKLLTKTFLLDADLPEFVANQQLETAIKAHRTSFTALQASLKDAKLEFFSLDMWYHAEQYDKAVASLQRLAQHISGLRSSCGLQFEAMHENNKTESTWAQSRSHPTSSREPSSRPATDPRRQTINIKADDRRRKMENELKREQSLEQNMFWMDGLHNSHGTGLAQSPPPGPVNMEREVSATSISNPRLPYDLETVPESPLEEAFQEEEEEEEGPLGQFIRSIRAPMKSLAYTCKQTIIHLQAHFTGMTTEHTPSFALLQRNLTSALELYEESEHRALTRLYRRKLKEHNTNSQRRQRQQSLNTMDANQLHSQLMKQFPAEDIFLVYFFVFCMLEFAKELVQLVGHVEHLFDEHADEPKSLWDHVRRFFHLMFFGRNQKSTEELLEKAAKKEETFIPNNQNTKNTLQTPSPTTRIRKFFLRLWRIFSWFRQHTVRYAVKACFSAVMVAMLAYIPATQYYFREYRMEWTLVTIMAVMSPTVGGTNLIAVLRVLATILGCIVAAFVYTAFLANPYILGLVTWLFSIPCFYIILNHKYGRFGQFALLAYNLVVLYSYNHRDDATVTDVFDLAWKRCVAVSVGVIIGLVVTAYIWPYEARKELRKGLSDLLLHLSWLYKQLVSVYSDTTTMGEEEDSYAMLLDQVFYETRHEEDDRHTPTPQELEALSQRNKLRAAQFQKLELALQVHLVSLQELLSHAPNEPRLKGPFPVKTYQSMLTSCQNILDKFLSIRIVVLKDVWAVQVRRSLMLPASKEWMDMAGNILLYFYLLASALQLKTPLPPFLPPAEHARELLMNKLEQVLPSVAANTTHATQDDESYVVYYAYVVMMESIIQELDKLGNHMKELYGTLVPPDQWARCFGLRDLEQNQFGLFPK